MNWKFEFMIPELNIMGAAVIEDHSTVKTEACKVAAYQLL